MTLTLLPPIIEPMLNGAGKLKGATQSGLIWATTKVAKDGNGGRIANYAGIAANYAARARWGNGPLKNGGLGMAGGDGRLAVAGKIVAGTFIVGVMAVPVAVDLLQLRQLKMAPAAGVSCVDCQQLLPEPPDGEAAPAEGEACPQCGRSVKQA